MHMGRGRRVIIDNQKRDIGLMLQIWRCTNLTDDKNNSQPQTIGTYTSIFLILHKEIFSD